MGRTSVELTEKDHNTVMRGIDYPEKIDLVGLSEEKRVVLAILQDREWVETIDEVKLLGTKINNYLSYVLDGQLYSDYPELAKKPVDIFLVCSNEPPSIIRNAITRVAAACEEFGMGFEVDVRP